jgi:hypothetical protein
MQYTNEDLGFILYNNRSVQGVVNNFLQKDINTFRLIQIESVLSDIKNEYFTNKMVEINKSELDLNAPDEIVTPSDLEEISEDIKHLIGLFNPREYEYLLERGITDKIIKKWSLIGLSSVKNTEHLRRIGATCHPVLRTILQDGIEDGGVIIPLFDDNWILKNCSIRKISIENSDKKTLKYSLACPDLPVWGISDIEIDSEIWITEGIFDMMALREMGKMSISCSSGMWTGPQLYQVLEKKPSKIVIVADNDEVGLRTASIIRDFFIYFKIETSIMLSKFAKDSAEHYFQKDKSIDDFEEINLTKEMIKNKNDNSFDFINHLKNRKF